MCLCLKDFHSLVYAGASPRGRVYYYGVKMPMPLAELLCYMIVNPAPRGNFIATL